MRRPDFWRFVSAMLIAGAILQADGNGFGAFLMVVAFCIVAWDLFGG